MGTHGRTHIKTHIHAHTPLHTSGLFEFSPKFTANTPTPLPTHGCPQLAGAAQGMARLPAEMQEPEKVPDLSPFSGAVDPALDALLSELKMAKYRGLFGW
jgi:hypothetical protein